MVSRRSGSAIAVAEYERMLATTREAGPMRDADELLLHIICSVMVGTLPKSIRAEVPRPSTSVTVRTNGAPVEGVNHFLTTKPHPADEASPPRKGSLLVTMPPQLGRAGTATQ